MKLKLGLYKLPEMNDNEIISLIKDQKICRIAFIDEKYPYIAPFQYTYVNESFYFHFTNYGKKIDIIKNNRNVCVSIEQLATDLKRFHFVTFQGTLLEVKDINEKQHVLSQLASEGSKKFSKEFLSAHGLDKDKSWKDLARKKDLLIFKLGEIKNIVALGSS
ncbi:MAG: pyridoxamine 5'-phosphate oxidase family protein [Candidatus Lokiarchaeota archaeon]|nr:pyridoxamine 5'-phosphate oxidase family protein [Candidatus Lokiarchaeota archaeon]MBD3198377.1 pyridoxamine 5'-phosphate oxidase family protein [Candidatus Lokiarchaeota archaeon]